MEVLILLNEKFSHGPRLHWITGKKCAEIIHFFVHSAGFRRTCEQILLFQYRAPSMVLPVPAQTRHIKAMFMLIFYWCSRGGSREGDYTPTYI